MTLTAAVAFTVTVRCAVCGEIPCGTIADAEERQEQHTGITGHATVLEVAVTE